MGLSYRLLSHPSSGQKNEEAEGLKIALMKEKTFEPKKLDVEAFVNDAGSINGQWPAAEFERIASDAPADAPVAQWPNVVWSAQGELCTPRGAQAQYWLHLQAQASVSRVCQRCLRAVQESVVVDANFRFVSDEVQANQLDPECDEDLLVLQRSLNLQELLEDELLLAMSIVPMHDTCPQPLPVSATQSELVEAELEKRSNPFAVLATLRSKPEGS